MSDEINYKNNPLHGLSLKSLVTEIVDHYGFPILDAYLNINCFKTNPSIESSIKFLKKTEWARTKVEVFYLYQFKNLPRASSEQFMIPPRDRIIPEGDLPGEPALLSFEDAERLKEKRAKKAAERSQNMGNKRTNKRSNNTYPKYRETKPREKSTNSDPWAKWKE
jgi:uncharacterized protein (DUF2132 family)